MNKKKQRITIAEHVDWQEVEFGVGPNSNLCLGDRPNRVNGKITSYTVDCGVPDYLNDLHAIVEAARVTFGGSDGWQKFVFELLAVSGATGMSALDDMCCLVQATAAQWAEAFLRTIGKWEDEG